MLHLHDDLLDHYDYATDPLLNALRVQDRTDLHVMMAYGSGASNFGRQMTAHQNRVAKDSAAFLRHLGFSDRAAQNFRAAMLFHDIGKTHAQYHPDFWQAEDRPSPADKVLSRQHARLGAEMFAAAYPDLAEHPHFHVRHAVTRYHHERLDGGGPERENISDWPAFVQISCIIDAYDGDRIQRPHQPHRRTAAEALARMADPDGKYAGAFDSALLARYKAMKEKKP